MYYQNLLVLFITHNTLNQRYFFSFSSLSIDRNIKKLFFIGKCFFFKLLLVIKFKIRIGTKNKSTTSTFIFFTHNSTLSSDIKFINFSRSEEHTSELQSRGHIVCRLLLEKQTENIH